MNNSRTVLNKDCSLLSDVFFSFETSVSSSHSNLQFLSRECLLQEKTWLCKVFETHSKPRISIILSGLASVRANFLNYYICLFAVFVFF